MPAVPPNVLQGDLHVAGNFTAQTMSVPASSVKDGNIAAGAPGAYIAYTKNGQMHKTRFVQPNTAATSETKPFYLAFGLTGTVLDIKVASIAVAIGAATVTVDVKKNGISILNSVVTLNNANTARVAVLASLLTTAFAAGDFFEVVVVATAGGGTLPTGLIIEMTVAEDPA